MSSFIDDDSVISLSKLLSQPLIATLEADFDTAKRFVEFMTTYGLEEVEASESRSSLDLNKTLSLKMVTFLYRQIDPTDRQEKLFRVQVPLISLIPLPLLQIERAEFDFNLRIYSEISLNTPAASANGLKRELKSEDQSPLKNDGNLDPGFRGFRARLSPTVGRQGNGEASEVIDANMRVKVQMRQADLPGGLAYWISTFTNAASVNPVPYTYIQIDPSTLFAADPTGGEQSLKVTVTLLNEKNIGVENQEIIISFDEVSTRPNNPQITIPTSGRTDKNGRVEFIIKVSQAISATSPVTYAKQQVSFKITSNTSPSSSNTMMLVIPGFTA